MQTMPGWFHALLLVIPVVMALIFVALGIYLVYCVYILLIEPLISFIGEWLDRRPSDRVIKRVNSIAHEARNDITIASTEYLDEVTRNARR